MAQNEAKIEEVLAPLRSFVKEQGELVRKLKHDGAPELDVNAAVVELKARKKALEEKEVSLYAKEAGGIIDRPALENLLRRRFFFDQSFSIYGGVTGLYDFGPMGCAMKANLLQLWRRHFVLEEGMFEVDCAMLTPEVVLKASGHVERFSDYMVKDAKTGECFRADHLIKGHAEKMIVDKKTPAAVKEELTKILARLDGFGKEDLQSTIEKFKMKSPLTNNELTEPTEFNLMFPTMIGPAGNIQGYLRPETAQGIFVNFKRLLEFNQGRLPFAAAQIGAGFRNEISPRQGLIRVREFTMAEIEHFVDPSDKRHAKYHKVKDYEMVFFSACNQLDGERAVAMSVDCAVYEKKMVANETLAYYLARVHQFLVKVGVDPTKLRFRQHLSNEMAHYACDCWDAEILTSYGWIECVGCADRSCYDLTQHTKATGVKLVAERELAEPRTVDVVECVPNAALVGKQFRKDAKAVMGCLEALSPEQCNKIESDLREKKESAVTTAAGQCFTLTDKMVDIKRYSKKVHVEEVVPSVIEPSFGVGRIMYAILEHTFCKREGDEQRTYLNLPAVIAPVKCSILPLSAQDEFVPIIQRLDDLFTQNDIAHKTDDSSGSIGRRYARTDEIGIPFGITIDFDSLKEPETVTLRNRENMEQVRVETEEAVILVRDLCRMEITWEEICDRCEKFGCDKEK